MIKFLVVIVEFQVGLILAVGSFRIFGNNWATGWFAGVTYMLVCNLINFKLDSNE